MCSLKLKKLRENIGGLEDAVVAYSGGVDSTLLLKICKEELGDKTIAVTAVSPSYPLSELENAKKIAEKLGVRHVLIEIDETKDSNYSKNDHMRCYFCKTRLYSEIKKIAEKFGFRNILSGANADDCSDYRPGMAAGGEMGVKSPLKDAGIKKIEVREIAKKLGLENWNKPASPCLASRIPYGTEVTRERLEAIDKAEKAIKGLGVEGNIRVRYYGKSAGIEVDKGNIEKVREKLGIIKKEFERLGFSDVKIDEFRSGKLNDVIE